ncbi:MAG: FtsX-like permease family protein [Bacteroidetes bacterium]|jgi:putative ABC transport system permease protein|nr:FtsX-like permease family protein [Bacteroidota bacterium]
MLRSYLTTTLRTLWKHRGTTTINVLGLAAGMAVCLLVALLFWDQVTHDAFHPGSDRLYRVTTEHQNNSRPFAASPAGLAPVLREDVTGTETATRISRRTRENVVRDGQGYWADGLYAEPGFFDVFGFELATGRADEALVAPYTAVVSEELAERVYGTMDVIGETFRLGDDDLFTITGVVNRSAYRSHLAFDVLLSFATLQQTRPDRLASDWERGYSYYTYLRLAPRTTPSDLAASLRAIEEQYLPPPTEAGRQPLRFQLQAVANIPFGPTLSNEIAEGMVPATVGYFLGALALLVLLAAGFNYVNLSTARSLTRAREVGVRKAVGARRWHVIGQFIAEAVVVSGLALAVAVALLQGLVPLFNQLSIVHQVGAQIDVAPGPMLYAVFVGFALSVGGLAGLYPAWHLSRFQPARVLKSSGPREPPGTVWMTPRKVLIVLQFTVALVVMVTTVLVYQQAAYLGRAPAGIQTEDLVHIELQEAPYAPFQQQAQQVPAVEQVGAANTVPLSGATWSATLATTQSSEPVTAVYYAADFEFVDAVGLSLVATDGWTETSFENGPSVLINEGAAARLGFDTPEAALGEPLTLNPDSARSVRVAGVVRNFHTRYSDAASKPVVFHFNPSRFQVALVRVAPEAPAEATAALTAAWGRFDDTNPAMIRNYADLVRNRTGAAALAEISGILALVAGLAVLISCLGLLGIALYAVQTRVKEIGIRKALGASVPSIVGRLSRDFLVLIGAAVGLGLPLAWWINALWLDNFAYRIALSVGPLILCAAGLLALALCAIGSQTIRAARLDPATTLRDE